jgi:hypothetical protein
MQFLKHGDVSKIIRIIGSEDDILSISFADNFSNNLEVIEWGFSKNLNF